MSSIVSRSYDQDIFGRRVLVGLTCAETHEFEELDAQPFTDEQGNILRWELPEAAFPSCHVRWLELYKKHQTALLKDNTDR